MTTYLFPAGDYNVLRTNRFANPSFETGVAGVTYDLADFDSVLVEDAGEGSPVVLAGSSSLHWTLSATPSTVSLAQAIELPAEAGQWAAVRIPMRFDGWTGRVQVFIFPDAPGAGEGTIIDAPADTWVYPTATYQVPGGATSLIAYVYVYGEVDDDPPAGAEGHTDAWIAAAADTQSDAELAVLNYFDGDTTDQAFTFYDWTGEPNASTSTEYTFDAATSPKVVLNYERRTATNVIVHQSINAGVPLVTRRGFGFALPRGTFEFLCEDEARARSVESICSGLTDVEVASDDVPDAPFVFVPTDDVIVRKNEPYDSYTVFVPYARRT